MDSPPRMSRSPKSTVSKKTIVVPKKSLSPGYKKYTEHPNVSTLNQVMLNYLDIESILKLYAQDEDYEIFETQEALNILAQRFKLKEAKTFKQFLKNYDTTYATVRSYHYIDRGGNYDYEVEQATQIFVQAALEGNIQAMINGLKLYPELKDVKTLNRALEIAAMNGYEAVIDLLLDLGATNTENQILSGAARGGHLNIMKAEKYKAYKKSFKNWPGILDYGRIIGQSIKGEHLEVLKYLLTFKSRQDASVNCQMYIAGTVSNEEIINYLISEGATKFDNLVVGAIEADNFDIILKYWDLAMEINGDINEDSTINDDDVKLLFERAAIKNRPDVLKFLLDEGLIEQETLDYTLGVAITKDADNKIIKYLKSMGANEPPELLED